MTFQSDKLLVVIGATASGKSALAMALAERAGGEILSVDSMQVYRGMDVGTAKPTAEEQRRVRHHLVDVADPNETFTVHQFVKLADDLIRDAAARGVPLIVTGGTPLYYKALFEGLFDGPGADAQIRAAMADQPLDELHKRLSTVDPAAAARIHVNDRKRIVRALEVFELTGKPISSFQTEWASNERRYDARWIGLQWERDEVNRRINARVKQMLAAGWLDETRTLLNRYGELSKTAAEATGYAELIAHLRGEMSLDDAAERTKIATRQLARRQMKWFRRFEHVNWIAGDQPLEALLSAATK